MGFINPSGKLLRHPDRLAAWRRGELFAPIGVEIDLTNRCNLGCKFCLSRHTHTRGFHASSERAVILGDEMDLALLERVCGEMREFGVRSVTFTGGGEPMLHPGFAEAVRIVKRAGFPLGLYTNGTLVDEDTASLIRSECAWVVVSLDAWYAQQYLGLKQVDAFDQACAGVQMLTAAKGDAIVGVSFLVSWRWNGYYEAAQMLGKKLGANYVEFRPMVVYDDACPSRPAESTEWVVQQLPRLERVGIEPRMDVRIEQFRLYASYTRPYDTCYGVLFTGVVSPNGKVWRCVNRRGFPDSCVGDLTTESFREVWARQRPQTDFEQCRVLCRADVINRKLAELAKPLPHEVFV